VSQAALVGWGEAFVKPAGTDILSCLAARCRSLAATEGQAGAGADAVRLAGRGSSDGHASSSSQENQDMLQQGGSSSAELNSSSSSLGGWSPPPADIPFSVLRAATRSKEQQHAAAPGEAVQRLATRLAAGNKAATCSDSWTTDGAAAVVQHHLIRSGVVLSHESHNRRHDEGLHGVVHPKTLPTPLPQVQTRQDVWAQAQVPSPAELRELKCQLAKLLIAVDYQTGSSLQVLSEFKDFG
jgi:hypothetical protein